MVIPVSRRPSTRISGRRPVVVPLAGPGRPVSLFAGCFNGEFYLVVGLGGASSGVAGRDKKQVVEGMTRLEGRVGLVAAMLVRRLVVGAVRRGKHGAVSWRGGSRGSA